MSCNLSQRRIKFFRGWARIATAKPWLTIFLCLFVTIAMGIGVMNMTPESRTLKLYVPQDSQSHRDLEAASAYFPNLNSTRPQSVMLYSDVAGDLYSVLTADAVKSLWQIRETIVAANTSSGKTFADICAPAEVPRTECLEVSFLNFFDFDPVVIAALTTDAEVLDAVNNYDPAKLFRNGRLPSMSATTTMGDYSTDPVTGLITKAPVMGFTLYTLESEESLEWETAAMDAIYPILEKLNTDKYLGEHIRLTHEFERQLDDDTADSAADDIMFISLTFTIMCTFLCGYMSISWDLKKPEMGSIWMGWMACANVGFSVIFSVGFVSAIGIIYPDMASVFPFLLLGIGVDDAIIMVNEFRRLPVQQKPRDRVIETVGRTGSMITLTSMTDFFAFFFGMFSVFPAISSFCTYMMVGVFIDWVFQLTFFPACLAIEARRQHRAEIEGPVWGGKSDHCCDRFLRWLSQHAVRCSDLAHEPTDESTLTPDSVTEVSDLETAKTKREASPYKPSILIRFLVHPITAACILVLYITICILAGFGAAQVEQGLDTGLLSPKGSILHDYNWARNVQYGGPGLPVALVYLNSEPGTGNVVYRSEESLTNMNDVEEQLLRDGDYQNKSISYAGPLSLQPASVALGDFLTAAPFYVQDMGFDNLAAWELEYAAIIDAINNEQGPGAVRSTIFMDIPFAGRAAAQESKRILLDTRTQLDLLNSRSQNHQYYVTDSTLIYFEQYIVIFRETMRSLLLALVAVFFSALLLTGSLQTAIFGTIGVASVDLWLFGLMFALDIALDSVSSIILIMAIGLAADYVMHVVFDIFHPYDRQFTKMEPKLQVAHGLEHAGLAVLTGGLTTFIAFIPTAFSNSHIFTTFFRLLFGTTGFGLVHGLIVAPAFILFYLEAVRRMCGRSKVGEDDNEKDYEKDLEGSISASAPTDKDVDCIGGSGSESRTG